MIKITKGHAPEPLTATGGVGQRELQKAIEFFSEEANRSLSFSFKAYKHETVKAELNESFGHKCAYCETSYWASQPVDIEHFRPKGAVVVDAGNLLKPGYYWLAGDWANLLPSCIDCNRARYHEIQGDAELELLGKSNLFPIENDTRTELYPGAEGAEQRLLVHPCEDDPEDFFEYHFDLALTYSLITPKPGGVLPQRMSELSISTYGLNRIGLSSTRGEVILRVYNQIEHVKKDLINLNDNPERVDFRERLAWSISELTRFENKSRPYAGNARSIIGPIMERIEIKISEAVGALLDDLEGTNLTDKLLKSYPPPAIAVEIF